MNNLGKLIGEKEYCDCMDCMDCPAYRRDEDGKHSYCDLVSYAKKSLSNGAKQTREAFDIMETSKEYLAKKGERNASFLFNNRIQVKTRSTGTD